jgi:hypothetical protein
MRIIGRRTTIAIRTDGQTIASPISFQPSSPRLIRQASLVHGSLCDIRFGREMLVICVVQVKPARKKWREKSRHGKRVMMRYDARTLS